MFTYQQYTKGRHFSAISLGVGLIAIMAFAQFFIGCAGHNNENQAGHCATGKARPISLARTVHILEANGYKVVMRPEDCGADVKDIVMGLNAVPKSDSQALVICDIRLRPIYGKGFHRVGRRGLVQDNVMCGVYPGSKKHAAAEKKKLLTIVRKLAMR